MSKLVPVKDFELAKVKFNGKKGLDIQFWDLNNPNELWSVSSDSIPSDDYHKALSQLKEVFAYSLGLSGGWDFAREHTRKNEDALKKARMFWHDEIERCNVTGLTVVGSADSKGIKISGSLQTELGTVGCASPTIRFDANITSTTDEPLMIGDLAETAFSMIQNEIWMFIFKGKRGGELFPAEEVESGLNGVVKMSKVG